MSGLLFEGAAEAGSSTAQVTCGERPALTQPSVRGVMEETGVKTGTGPARVESARAPASSGATSSLSNGPPEPQINWLTASEARAHALRLHSEAKSARRERATIEARRQRDLDEQT